MQSDTVSLRLSQNHRDDLGQRKT
ncbi:uncharacterized protein METZ01_LOCUS367462, partial [marine metagenome]